MRNPQVARRIKAARRVPTQQEFQQGLQARIKEVADTMSGPITAHTLRAKFETRRAEFDRMEAEHRNWLEHLGPDYLTVAIQTFLHD
jgi:hypothetical protein